jgi:hypothetical protein
VGEVRRSTAPQTLTALGRSRPLGGTEFARGLKQGSSSTARKPFPSCRSARTGSRACLKSPRLSYNTTYNPKEASLYRRLSVQLFYPLVSPFQKGSRSDGVPLAGAQAVGLKQLNEVLGDLASGFRFSLSPVSLTDEQAAGNRDHDEKGGNDPDPPPVPTQKLFRPVAKRRGSCLDGFPSAVPLKVGFQGFDRAILALRFFAEGVQGDGVEVARQCGVVVRRGRRRPPDNHSTSVGDLSDRSKGRVPEKSSYASTPS